MQSKIFFVSPPPSHQIGSLALSLPTRGARRVQQSLQLAQALLEKQRECERAHTRLAEVQREADQVCHALSCDAFSSAFDFHHV